MFSNFAGWKKSSIGNRDLASAVNGTKLRACHRLVWEPGFTLKTTPRYVALVELTTVDFGRGTCSTLSKSQSLGQTSSPQRTLERSTYLVQLQHTPVQASHAKLTMKWCPRRRPLHMANHDALLRATATHALNGQRLAKEDSLDWLDPDAAPGRSDHSMSLRIYAVWHGSCDGDVRNALRTWRRRTDDEKRRMPPNPAPIQCGIHGMRIGRTRVRTWKGVPKCPSSFYKPNFFVGGCPTNKKPCRVYLGYEITPNLPMLSRPVVS